MKNSRMAGLLLPLFSLRRLGDAGIGDLMALEEWIDWAHDSKVKFLQLLPINALGTGDAPSPYSAISSVALEPLYLSLERVPGIEQETQEEARLLAEHRQKLPPRQLPAGEHLVDYLRVREEKEGKLAGAWKNFRDDTNFDAQREQFLAWVEAEGAWLDDYSTYRVAATYFKSLNWWEWPCQSPEELRALVSSQAITRDLKQQHQWLQWLCAQEWKQVRAHANAAGVILMGDVPIGISVASADVFFQRHLFDMQWSGGAPAEGNFAQDPFTGKWGQNWGIPLYRWDLMAQDGYSWWRQRIRKMAEIFGMYRIDHILGFYRIYAFPWMPDRNPEFLHLSPDEAAARCEGRRPGFIPHDDWTPESRKSNLMQGDKLLQAIMAISHDLIVIGEDLGCVPDYVRPNLSQLRIAGFKIPHWEIDCKQKITPGQEYNQCSFATYATHDFPPFPQDWNGWHKLAQKAKNIDPSLSPEEKKNIIQVSEDCQRVLNWLADYAGMDEELTTQPWNAEIKDKLFTALMQCNSHYTALMWTELFDVDLRLNTPGTEGGSNWRARMLFTAAEAQEAEQSAWIKQLIQSSQRG